jgi:thymidine kinase
MNAYLELLVGPMYSGKSTMLIQRAERFERQKKHVLYVKYAQDNRYSADSISTHQLVMKPALLVQDLTEVIDHIQALYVDVVVIDEGQFIKNIDLADELVAKHKKVVIIAALDADFKREPFRHITDLIAKAERV